MLLNCIIVFKNMHFIFLQSNLLNMLTPIISFVNEFI